jgi:hypothetical protein
MGIPGTVNLIPSPPPLPPHVARWVEGPGFVNSTRLPASPAETGDQIGQRIGQFRLNAPKFTSNTGTYALSKSAIAPHGE